jgi:nitrate/nitrite-specific signal transduction histidine kinase
MSLTAIAGERPINEPIELARRLHDTVAQRLAGLSYLLASVPEHSDALEQCRAEVDAALGELRDALGSVGAPSVRRDAYEEVLAELRLLRAEFEDLELHHRLADAFEAGPQTLVAAFLAEALRNVRKHAAPNRVSVDVVHQHDVTFVIVLNDGVKPRRGRSCGAGRRLLEVEASLHGSLVDSSPAEPGCWRQQLILPGALPQAA